ncbi:MAG: DUF2339 domain-containing protein, partial [Verrucomicrobia bacterium]|nr:DUF2339 domain-containing protein [Verrucomicrobiota bacterium]
MHGFESLLVLLGLVLLVLPVVSLIFAVVSQQRISRIEKRLAEQEEQIGDLAAKQLDLRAQQPKPPPAERLAVPPKPAAPPPVIAPEPPKLPPQPVAERASVPPRIESPTAPAAPPAPPKPPPLPPPPVLPPQPAFDWEKLLGVRGAAWLGAIAFVIAASLFLKYSFEHGLITPPMRVAIIVLSGVGLLFSAEFGLRKGYATTANALCGAGVAMLYAGFFAAHGVYHLLPMTPTFALMAMVTVVACLLAIRYDAMFIAVLGLLGGFATPIVLSTGEDRPIGLFSYILLLDVGLLWVSVRKNWNAVVLLSLAATLFMEVAWFHRFMTPEKMALGLGIFSLFALLYLALPLAAKKADEKTTLQAATLGGLAPFAFALYMAGTRAYAIEWPLLFGFIALLDLAAAAMTLARGQTVLVVSNAVATAFTLVLWSAQALNRDNLWGASLAAIGLGAIFNLLPRAARRWRPQLAETDGRVLEAAGLVAGAGVAIYAAVMVGRAFGEPPWVFLCLLAAICAMVWERGGRDGLPLVPPFSALAVAGLVQLWFFQNTAGETLLRNLSLPLLTALGWSLAAAKRQAAPEPLPPAKADAHEAGAALAIGVALAGLFGCLDTRELGADPWPLFLSMAVLAALLVMSALRRDWSWLVAVAAAASAAFAGKWHAGYFTATDWPVALPIYAAFYLAWLALPFAMPRALAPSWRNQPWPWLASALSGPAFFLPIYKACVAAWGKDFIGVLPVAMAAASVLALAGVRQRYAADDPALARQRLRNLALFGAVALGFISVAIPLQLDKQWITIGWALEAAAVWWLYLRVPHVGLKYFGMALFVVVGARLLVNPEVLRYEERGLLILNWILYTYGVSAICCLVGAAMLRTVEAARLSGREREFFGNGKWGLAPVVGFLGLLLVFALINLEIADWFS